MTLRYAYSLHERAAQATIVADDSARSELLGFFNTLARNPGRCGAEQAIDEAGRPNEVAYTDHFRVVYWADHAAKEVRIIDVRRY
jgi:hypothetical protein